MDPIFEIHFPSDTIITSIVSPGLNSERKLKIKNRVHHFLGIYKAHRFHSFEVSALICAKVIQVGVTLWELRIALFAVNKVFAQLRMTDPILM
jgi:hypothetical protein